MNKPPPLIAHVIHHLWIGGLENGLINLINNIPADQFRHVIICMDDYSDFRERLQRNDVEVVAIHKKPGKDPASLWRLYKLFRQLKPDILHTRNLSGLDALLPAYMAGIKYRIHGEHGRDVDDLDGNNRKLQWLRRLHKPLIHRYIPLSKDLENYLLKKIGVPSKKITQIYNGVDTKKFFPAGKASLLEATPKGFLDERSVVIGTVGRCQVVKDQQTLIDSFIRLANEYPIFKDTARLIVLGDGPLLPDLKSQTRESGLSQQVWMPGSRNDIATLLPGFDLFVLPSLAEGISNTVLEAMACGVPVIATAVGGNPELIIEGKSGQLIQPSDEKALSETIYRYASDPHLRESQGIYARKQIESSFSMNSMVSQYIAEYESGLNKSLWVANT